MDEENDVESKVKGESEREYSTRCETHKKREWGVEGYHRDRRRLSL